MAATTLDRVTRAEATADEADFVPIDDVIPRPGRDRTIYNPNRHGLVAFDHDPDSVEVVILARPGFIGSISAVAAGLRPWPCAIHEGT